MIDECLSDYLFEYFQDQKSNEGRAIFADVEDWYDQEEVTEIAPDLEQRIISYLRHREDVEDCNDYDNTVRPNAAMRLLMELEPNR